MQEELDSLNKWATAMLTVLPTVLKSNSRRSLRSYQAVIDNARGGKDAEYARRSKTGLTLYVLNYAVAVAMTGAHLIGPAKPGRLCRELR